MPSAPQTPSPIPAPVEAALQQFCSALHAALGDQLLSVLLYGGLAKGEFIAQSSDVNVLVVLRQVTVDLLDRMIPAIDQARLEIRLSLLTLAQSDLEVSSDVFPTKFLDIQRHHRLLFGQQVLGKLEITRDRLRRQCAREIQNLLLRLRQFYLQRSRRPELIEGTLKRVLSPFLANLATVVELKTGAAPSSKADVIQAAPGLGVNEAIVRDLLSLKRGELKPDAAGLRRLYADFLAAVEASARVVEAL